MRDGNEGSRSPKAVDKSNQRIIRTMFLSGAGEGQIGKVDFGKFAWYEGAQLICESMKTNEKSSLGRKFNHRKSGGEEKVFNRTDSTFGRSKWRAEV